MTPAEGARPGALDGVLVADFSRVLAGPYATMLLADLGADVVKVERPGAGDDTRQWGPPWDVDGRATYFESVNRNKRSVALDLRDPDGLAAARSLAHRADVLVENFVPGTMERLGLGYDTLREDNPGLVYAGISGFGRDAGADLPGYDLLVQAVGGLMSVTGPAPGQPTKVGVAVVDVLTGLHLTIGVLAALRHRDRTGLGQRVDATLLTSVLSALVNQAAGYLGAGVGADAVRLATDLGLEPVVEIAGSGRSTPSRQIAHPARLSVTPATYRLAPPGVGADTDQVLADLRADGLLRAPHPTIDPTRARLPHVHSG